MNELINQICALDEQIKKNREYIDLVEALSKRGLVNRDMADNATMLGLVTITLLTARYELSNKLFEQYGITYLMQN